MSDEETCYDRRYWFCYGANFSLQVMVALMFRYADFVKAVGGDEHFDLGMIVGFGMIGSLSMRVYQAVAIDRYGTRPIWLASLLLIIVSLAAHLTVTTAHSPAVYLYRLLFMTGVSGAYGGAITFTFLRAPPRRMAEAVGVLGTSGFLGLIVGSYGSDWLCPHQEVSRSEVNSLFIAAIGLMVGAFCLVWLATWRVPRPRLQRRPPLLAVIYRYHPGVLLLMCAVMGFGIAVPYVFLRPYQDALNINGLGLYFTVYAVTAFVSRLLTRTWPARFGNRPMVLGGMVALIASILLYLVVHQRWQLIFPATLAGISHAVLFPAIVAGGSATFPHRYRGLATSLMLGSFDVGTLIGAPIVGGLLRGSELLSWDPFPSTFVIVACLLAATTVYFFAHSRTHRDVT